MKAKTILLAIYLLTVAFLPSQAFAQIGSVRMTAKEIKRQNRQNEAYLRELRQLRQERLQNPDVMAQLEKEQTFAVKRARRDTAEAARQTPLFANLEKKTAKSRERGKAE